MSLLEDVATRSNRIRDYERKLSEAVLSYRTCITNERELLDAEMVAAVDWGHLPPGEVAMVAGYKSHAAIRDARRRIEKREAEVR